MKKLMDLIEKTMKGRITEAKLTPLEDEIRKCILREFARNGRPPTSGELMEGLQLSSVDVVNQTIEKLQGADILSIKGDKISSAYPFSAAPTLHKVIFEDGHKVYALCATDALGIHFMLNEDITILSRCPECEEHIKIVIENDQIDSYDPDGIIEFVSDVERCGCTAETLCPFINFFCSKEHLERWREKNSGFEKGEIYSLNDALEHGKTIFGDLLK